jgi:transposase
LLTIPGVGPIVSETFVTEIYRPERFKRSEEICAYVGLAPITSQSGLSKPKAKLRHVGQRYLRSILVEAAWTTIRKDSEFASIYTKIRTKTDLAQKAIVAVARKLLIVIWRVAVENRPYIQKSNKDLKEVVGEEIDPINKTTTDQEESV